MAFISPLLLLLVLGLHFPWLSGSRAEPQGLRSVPGQQGHWAHSGPLRRETVFVVGAEWLARLQERELAGVVDVSCLPLLSPPLLQKTRERVCPAPGAYT